MSTSSTLANQPYSFATCFAIGDIIHGLEQILQRLLKEGPCVGDNEQQVAKWYNRVVALEVLAEHTERLLTNSKRIIGSDRTALTLRIRELIYRIKVTHENRATWQQTMRAQTQ